MARYAYVIQRSDAIGNKTIGVATSSQKVAEMLQEYAEDRSTGGLEYDLRQTEGDIVSFFKNDGSLLTLTVRAAEHGTRTPQLDEGLRVEKKTLNTID